MYQVVSALLSRSWEVSDKLQLSLPRESPVTQPSTRRKLIGHQTGHYKNKRRLALFRDEAPNNPSLQGER